MNRILRRILILTAVFLAAAGFLLFRGGRSQDEEVSYTVLGSSTLPLVSFTAEGVSVNPLVGYLQEMNAAAVRESVTPLPQDGRLPVTIDTCGNTITGISYEVRSIDGSNLIEEAELDSWDMKDGRAEAVLKIKDLIRPGEEYSLILHLTTEYYPCINYYTGILRNENLKTAEMLEYVTDFHRSEFSAAAAEKYAINWEVDGTGDADELSAVDIHSNFRQLTWKNLSPVQNGDAQITVLSLDENFGSFRVAFEVSAADSNGEQQTFYAEEFFCLQWSELRFYLMDYQRRVTQYFNPTAQSANAGELVFGVTGKEDLAVTASAGGTVQAFVQGGELFAYRPDEGELCRIYSQTAGETTLKRLNRETGVRVLDVSDAGDVEFVVYGYMSRGAHEGEVGLSYFRYTRESNTLDELLYMRSARSYERVKNDLDTLLVMRSNTLYFLFEDTVYAVDRSGQEIVRIVEKIASHDLIANADQSAIAWTQGDTGTAAGQIQVLYLDTGRSHALTAEPGMYLQGHGFIEKDFVASSGRSEDVAVRGFDLLYPQTALTITDEAGKETARYEADGVFITRVLVGDGQITLERMKESDGAFVRIDDDVLMQNDKTAETQSSPVSSRVEEARGRIRTLTLSKSKKTEAPDVVLPDQVSFYQAGEMPGTEPFESNHFYAYAGGRLAGIYDEAGYAVMAVADRMGYVKDTDGHRIWNRTTRYPESVSLTLAEESTAVPETERMQACLDAVLGYCGASADTAGPLAEGISARQILAEYCGGTAVNLESCDLKYVLRFLSRETPVLGMLEKDRPVVLAGYDRYNVLIYDPVRGETYKMGQEDATAAFAAAGNAFLGYVK